MNQKTSAFDCNPTKFRTFSGSFIASDGAFDGLFIEHLRALQLSILPFCSLLDYKSSIFPLFYPSDVKNSVPSLSHFDGASDGAFVCKAVNTAFQTHQFIPKCGNLQPFQRILPLISAMSRAKIRAVKVCPLPSRSCLLHDNPFTIFIVFVLNLHLFPSFWTLLHRSTRSASSALYFYVHPVRFSSAPIS